MNARVAVVQHQESCPPALFGTWLAEAGCRLDVVRPYLGDPIPDLTGGQAPYDAVLVLGGTMGAHDDATIAWLAPLKEQIRAAVEAEVPLLGICLGHQLTAAALGGRVEKNPLGQTVGVQPVGWTAEAGADALVGSGDPPGDTSREQRCVHWNNDVVVEAPAGTTVLAATPDGALQVARFGVAAWGIQAHPEADVAVVRRWAEKDREAHLARGVDQEAVLAELGSARDELASQWRPVAERLAALAGART